LPETVGGAGQPLRWGVPVAQENDGDCHQQQRRTHHPEDEDIGLGDGDAVARHQALPARRHAHPLDLEIIANAGGAEITVGADALLQNVVQRHGRWCWFNLAVKGRQILARKKRMR